jgi:hypothetical protein
MDRNQFPLDSHHVGVPLVAPKMISEPMVRFAQTVYLSCIEISTIFKWTKMSFHWTHVMLEYHQLCLKLFLKLWYV